MEEIDLTQRLHGMFEATMPALENITNGFLTQNQTMLQEGETQFVKILSSNLSFAEKIITEGQKSEVDKRFLSLLVPLQKIALAVRSLMAKQKMILLRDIIFQRKGYYGDNGTFNNHENTIQRHKRLDPYQKTISERKYKIRNGENHRNGR